MCECWSAFAAGAAVWSVVSSGLLLLALKLVLPDKAFFVLSALISIGRITIKLGSNYAYNYFCSRPKKTGPEDIPVREMRKPRVIDLPENSHSDPVESTTI
jgi:hypothetical protein